MAKNFCVRTEADVKSNMADYDGESEQMWDEYDWERFLQQQDHKTEKYMQLLETYLDDPRRDEIIAREMGWTHLLDAKDWSAEVDALFAAGDPAEDDAFDADQTAPVPDTFEEHTLYRAAFALTIWIDQLFDQDPSLQNEPPVVKLSTHSALASAKLKAITISMDAAAQLLSETLITAAQYSVLQQRLFQVRDGIITLMGEYRGEWRRRFGSEGFRS